MSNFKKFNRLELLVIKRALEKIESNDYVGITCEDKILQAMPTQNILTETKRNISYGDLDSQGLVYLITCDKASIDVRINAFFALFHNLNVKEEYPFSFMITKEEYIRDAVMPEIRSILLGIARKINKEIEKEILDEEINQNIGEATSGTNAYEIEDESKEHRGSDRENDSITKAIKKPNIFN